MRDDCLPISDVSRETLEKLYAFEDLIRQWTPRINLISPESRDDIWARHITDSAQLYDFSATAKTWADLGAGGGFPGMVIAVLLQGVGAPTNVTLVESDQRKAVFLKRACQLLELEITIVRERIEVMPPLSSDVVSARALAPLDTLLNHLARHLAPNGTGLLMKGRNWQKELSIAQGKWSFSYDAMPSKTDIDAVILRVWDVERKEP